MKSRVVSIVIIIAFFYTHLTSCADAEDETFPADNWLAGALNLRTILLKNNNIKRAIEDFSARSDITFTPNDEEDSSIRKYLLIYRKNENPSVQEMQTACTEAIESITTARRLDGYK